MHKFLHFTFILLSFSFGNGQRGDIDENSPLINLCASFDTCTSCLQEPNCTWCSEQNFTLTLGAEVGLSRCNPRDWYEKNKGDVYCDKKQLIDFRSSATVLVNESLSLGDEKSENQRGRKFVQLQPQTLSIQARLNEPVRFRMQFAQAANYPVDLYYIMDLSQTMEDDRNNLAKLGNSIAETMRKVTSNFRIGFGSFIDKTLAPFSSEYPNSNSGANSYLFQHHMNLSSDTSEFSMRVSETTTRGNVDRPEGGLEALMQVIVCQDQIGWRPESRRLIVFSTDEDYHLAGDGKLAGIVKPNDESCHMNQKGHYLRDRRQDYPSIAQIARQIVKHSINVIFAVPSSVEPIYRDLARRLPGAVIGTLKDDSSNIVELIKKEYQKLSSVVQMTHNASRSVAVKYFSSCLSGELKETRMCTGLKTGSVVEFVAELTATSCPIGQNFSEIIQFHPVGFNDTLIVELQVQCQCSCDQDTSPNDARCNGVGEYKCGMCQCNAGYSGIGCSCNLATADPESNSKRCRSPNSQLLECSGRGTCQCGICHCLRPPNNEGTIWGTHCECDDFSCPRGSNGMVCSGHGKCQCHGICKCSPGWSGSSCDCTSDESECRSGSELCSGRGKCLCGSCVCDEVQGGGQYRGKFCEDCPTCRCSEYVDCVEFLAFGLDSATREQCSSKNLSVEVVDNIQVENNEQRCTYELPDGCSIVFVYALDSNNKIRVEKICAKTAAIAGGVVGSIIIAGLLLLGIWKLLTVVHDRMEYSRFQKERALARWNRDENPMYRRPLSVFTNPTYNIN